MKTIVINDQDAEVIDCILKESLIRCSQRILDVEREIGLGIITNKEYGKKIIQLNSNRINLINEIIKQL